MKFNPVSRRHFLQGLGGQVLAVPLLPSLLPRSAMAASTVQPRFISVVSNYGQVDKYWYPTQDPSVKVAENVYMSKLTDISGPMSLVLGSHFDQLRSKLTLIRGLNSMDGHGHNRHYPLTGTVAEMPGDIGVNLPPRFPYSIDSVMAESNTVYPTEPRIRHLRLAPNIYPFVNAFSWNKVNGVAQSLPYEWNTQVIFQRIFGEGNSSKSSATDLSRILNATFGDYDKIAKGTAIGSEDKLRLTNFMDFISDISRKLNFFTPVSCAQAPIVPSDYLPVNAEQLHTTNIDMVVAALACGITRVVTLWNYHWESNLNADKSTFHGHSHMWNHGDLTNPSAQNYIAYNTWIGKRVSELMSKLDSFTDPDGKTALDNSIVFWTNEMGNSQTHSCSGMPILVGGSAGGRLRTNLYMDYRMRPFLLGPGDNYHYGRPYNEMLVTLLQGMGLTPSEYHRGGYTGFGGSYGDRLLQSEKTIMAPFISGAKDNPLPYYFV
jgi:hypothetical protein